MRFPTITSLAAASTVAMTAHAAETAHSMGFIGCSMAENVAQGYVAVKGERMWGPYGTSGMVVQSWTNSNSQSWQLFDQQAAKYGKPTAVWVQICVFTQGATYSEVKQLIANTRQHAAPNATIYITGQPLYEAGQSCFLAGVNGPENTDALAKQAAEDATQHVVYPGSFLLRKGEVQDGCHANTGGQQSLGKQAVAFWG
ncbi:Nn.00g067620.m01.CDS01 [Neocucurbitaria sp. VM-36]